MKQRALVLAIACFGAVAATPAQASSQSGNPIADKVFQTSLAVLKNGWQMVQKHGQPFANELVRKFPNNYKNLGPVVSKFVKSYGQEFNLKNLEEKRNLILEFWRLRSALNVAALVDPELLRNVIGIKADELKSLSLAFGKVHQKLKLIDPLFA